MPIAPPDLEAPIVAALATEQAQVLAADGDPLAHFWDVARGLLIEPFGCTAPQAAELVALAAQDAATPIDGVLDLVVRLRLLVAEGRVDALWTDAEVTHG